MGKKFSVALFGAGKVGEAICALLSYSKRYTVKICDADLERAKLFAQRWPATTAHKLDLKDNKQTTTLLEGCDAVISALPFYCNIEVAQYATKTQTAYFDLTEDIETTKAVIKLAEQHNIRFMPQCGIAPGFISIAAAHVMQPFDKVSSLKMRVGALPLFPTNRLKYNLSWSTEGLINEYCNSCNVIINGNRQEVLPLEGYEVLSLDGVEYEAFNTSGGLGSLCETLEGKIDHLSYKSLRYPGHRDLIAFLLHDLKFINDRDSLKKVFERGIPESPQDKCVIFVEARGIIDNRFTQRAYVSSIYHKSIADRNFSAIQVTTAAGVCGAMDLVLTGKIPKKKGLIKSEDIPLPMFLANEFGREYHDDIIDLSYLTKK
jgi:saccharopine dehydrogenase-like NADP-dependent oxidoreductase